MLLKYQYLFLLFILILIQGCRERELGVDLPYQGNQLFIFSELNPDKIIKLYLNQTYPPTGKFTVKKGLEGAEVNLLENGIFKERLAYSDSGTYISKSGLKPTVGNSYAFEIKLNGYADVDTQPIEIPKSIAAPKAVLERDTIPSIFTGKIARKLELEWLDDEFYGNNYVVIIEGEFQNQYLSIASFNIGKDSEIEDGCNFTRNRNQYIFRDLCFPLQKFRTSFGLDTYGFLQNNPNPFANIRRNVDTYKVSISNVSESYFRWLKDELQPEDIFLAFQLPKSRFSNVNNGYGIVIASNNTTFYLSTK